MADLHSAGLFASLRAAARVAQDRFLVGTQDEKERRRLVAALSAEGVVVEVSDTEQALEQLRAEPFEIVVLGLDESRSTREPVSAARELRPFCDLAVLTSGDPGIITDLCAREAAAV